MVIIYHNIWDSCTFLPDMNCYTKSTLVIRIRYLRGENKGGGVAYVEATKGCEV